MGHHSRLIAADEARQDRHLLPRARCACCRLHADGRGGSCTKTRVYTTLSVILLAPLIVGALGLLWMAGVGIVRAARWAWRWLQADQRHVTGAVILVVLPLVWFKANTPLARYERASREYDRLREDPAAEVARLVEGGRDLSSARFLVAMRMRQLSEVRDQASRDPVVRDSLDTRAERDSLQALHSIEALLGELKARYRGNPVGTQLRTQDR